MSDVVTSAGVLIGLVLVLFTGYAILDPALAIARRSTPRLAVPVGSVIVGGAQAAVMPQTSPSGWHIIGHTNVALFDPHRDEPSTLAPGDIVRFTIEDVWL